MTCDLNPPGKQRQGDEPFIEENHISTVISTVTSGDAVMGTLARPANANDEAVRPLRSSPIQRACCCPPCLHDVCTLPTYYRM